LEADAPFEISVCCEHVLAKTFDELNYHFERPTYQKHTIFPVAFPSGATRRSPMASNGNPPPGNSHQDEMRRADALAVLQSTELLMRAALRNGQVRFMPVSFVHQTRYLRIHEMQPLSNQDPLVERL
jgi:hypothetical protein